jgi:hypothetical protein
MAANTAALLATRLHLNNATQSSNQSTGNSTSKLRTPSSSPLSSASAKAALLAHKSFSPSHIDSRSHFSESTAQESLKDSRNRALMAATKSMATARPIDRTSIMQPTGKRDADLAQRRIVARQQEAQSRSDIIHIRREMLTERPPIRMEVEERQYNDALHTSAISMARDMYPIVTSTANASKQQIKHSSLQDTAQKLAAERLARIRDADEANAMRDYYGVSRSKSARPQNLLQKVRHPRNRSAGDGDDLERSRQVRSQMALLQAQIAQVDSEKLAQDRARLMAAAEKKVHQQMNDLDQKVFEGTGKMSPAMMSDWDAKSRARSSQQNYIFRQTVPDSAVNVGSGKFVDKGEIEDLAVERVGPTLRGIDEAVERRRSEDAEKQAREEEKRQNAKAEREKRKLEKAETHKIHGMSLRTSFS